MDVNYFVMKVRDTKKRNPDEKWPDVLRRVLADLADAQGYVTLWGCKK